MEEKEEGMQGAANKGKEEEMMSTHRTVNDVEGWSCDPDMTNCL